MAFGVKVKNLKTSKKYTIEEFFDAIKDKEFSAGKPELVKNGLAQIIVFPALDRQNQVQIMAMGFGKSVAKFSIQKNDAAGVGNLVLNEALDSVTKGISGLGRMVGDNTKKAEQLVDATYEELSAMGL